MSVLLVNKKNEYDTKRIDVRFVILYLMNGWMLVEHSAIGSKK